MLAFGAGLLSDRPAPRHRVEEFIFRTGLGLAVVLVLGGVVSPWVMLAVVGAVATIPWFLGLVVDVVLVQHEAFVDRSERADPRLLCYAMADLAWDKLRVPMLVAAWLGAELATPGIASVPWSPMLALVFRQRLLAVVLLMIAWSPGDRSLGFLAASLIVATALLPWLPARPPRRSLGLPAVRPRWRHPFGRVRLLVADRLLRRGLPAEAASRYAIVARRHTGLRCPALLRQALARLEGDEPQAALDAATEVEKSSPDERLQVAGRRVAGQALLQANRPEAALERLADEKLLKELGTRHGARAHLTRSEALVALGRWAEAVEEARRAYRGLKGRRQLDARLRAVRLECEASLAPGGNSRATEADLAAQRGLGLVMRVRWLRRHFVERRNDSEMIWSTGLPFLSELARLEALAAREQLTAGVDDEALGRMIDAREFFVLLGMRLDAAKASNTLAKAFEASGDVELATHHAIVGLVELDRVRYTLRGQASRARWSQYFGRALTDALRLAAQQPDGRLQAELIEIARLQSLPILRSSHESVDDAALSPAPTIRVRSTADMGRSTTVDGLRAVDIERSAASAAGQGAWWYSTWLAADTLYWALVPPTGEPAHGGIDASASSELATALAALRCALPVKLRPDESEQVVAARLPDSPLYASPEREERLARRLGELLIPPPLSHYLIGHRTRNQGPARLAVAAAPELGYVPWSLLAVPASDPDGPAPRLVELADWVLVPPAGLIDSGEAGPAPRPSPLRLAVLDTIKSTDEPELPAARSLARGLPAGATLLGGWHWHNGNVATRTAVLTELRRMSRDSGASSVLFACHAVQGTPERPSSSALVLAPEIPGGPPSRLSAADLIAFGADHRHTAPTQVLLAACDTSDLASAAAGEWLTLAPAFLAAGSRTVCTTVFPLVDDHVDWETDGVLRALKQGDDLANAVWASQRASLASWRIDGPRGWRPPVETPMVWGAYAVCAHGRGDASSATASTPKSQQPVARLSIRCLAALGTAYTIAAGIGDRTVTSAHFVAGYFLDQIERYQDRWHRGLIAQVTFRIVAKWLRAEALEGTGNVGPSRELVSVLAAALDIADSQGALVQPEDLINACRLVESRGSRFASVVGLSRRPQFAGAVMKNLIDGRSGAEDPASAPRDIEEERGLFLMELVTAADSRSRTPGGSFINVAPRRRLTGNSVSRIHGAKVTAPADEATRRWAQDRMLDIWLASDSQGRATGDTTILNPYTSIAAVGASQGNDNRGATRFATLVDIDVPSRWLRLDNWANGVKDDETHPALLYPSERVGRPPATHLSRFIYPQPTSLPPVPTLSASRVAPPFPAYPVGRYWPSWRVTLPPLGQWMEELRPPKTEHLQVDWSQLAPPSWGTHCSELLLEMLRLKARTSVPSVMVPWLAVTVDRIIFGSGPSSDVPNANPSLDDPEPEWAVHPTHIFLGQIRFEWITRMDVEFSYATGWSRKPLRTKHGRPERRLLRVWLHNGWDAVLIRFRLPTDPASFKDGRAQKHDEELEYSVDQLIRYIANHRLTTHPRHQRDIDSLHALARQGLQLPPSCTTSSKIAKRTMHHDIPAAEMISLPMPHP
jgi:hypothetical protein